MKNLFPIVLGFTDGIITSLVFTAGLITSSGTIYLPILLKISIGSSIIGAFSYFIAKYSELRGELIQSAMMINPSSPLHLLKSKQGLIIVGEAVIEAVQALVSGFFGAFITMFPAYEFPGSGLESISIAVVSLGIMGALISRYLYGGAIRWALTFVSMGLITVVIGIYLNIV